MARYAELLRIRETEAVVLPFQPRSRIPGDALEEAVEAGLKIDQRLLQTMMRHVAQERGMGVQFLQFGLLVSEGPPRPAARLNTNRAHPEMRGR